MTSNGKRAWLMRGVAVAVACGLFLTMASITHLDRAAAQEAGHTDVTANAGMEKAMRNLQDSMNTQSEKIKSILGTHGLGDVITDPALQKELAPKILPLMQTIVDQFDSFMKQYPKGSEMIRDVKFHELALMDLLGDQSAAKTISQGQQSKNTKVAFAAKLADLEVQWHKGGADAAAQTKILDQIQVLVKAEPANDDLTAVLLGFMQTGQVSPDNKVRINKIVTTELKGPYAMALQKQQEAQHTMENKLDSLKNKPITITGTRVDGTSFSSAKWKGKVVLVDFWATWCGPCRASLPHVVSLYNKYHAKGLNIVSVSNDNDAGALKAFLKAHPQMSWPQLFDAQNPGWSPMAANYGITGIPTQFVIDRKGILRHIIVGFSPDLATKLTADIKPLLNN